MVVVLEELQGTMFTEILFVCSLKSMCIPSFGDYVPFKMCGVWLFYRNYNVYQHFNEYIIDFIKGGYRVMEEKLGHDGNVMQ